MTRPLYGSAAAWLILFAVANADILQAQVTDIALYPLDNRRQMTDADTARFAGAGVLMCYSDFGTL